MSEAKNEIVVYQPNETIRLDVRLENETVWLTQSQMGLLFGCTTRNVRLHLENIYSCGELTQEATRKDFFLVRLEGASLKDIGGKCFGFTKMDSREIRRIKKAAFSPTP